MDPSMIEMVDRQDRLESRLVHGLGNCTEMCAALAPPMQQKYLLRFFEEMQGNLHHDYGWARGLQKILGICADDAQLGHARDALAWTSEAAGFYADALKILTRGGAGDANDIQDDLDDGLDRLDHARHSAIMALIERR